MMDNMAYNINSIKTGCRDGFELEFSGSSEPELWMFRAEPRRAGTLQFSSWNRADNTDNMYVKKLKFWAFITIIICFMFNFMNLYKRIGIFGVKHYNLGTWFEFFQPYSIKAIYEKKKLHQNQNFSSFLPIFDFELDGKRSRAEPSWAENLSARTMARASLAWTHHYG